MDRRLDEAVVVLTGASSGIGRATALEFARKGAAVVLAARREQTLRDVARQIETEGGRALVVACDVSDADAVRHLAEQAVTEFGRVDVWVNNAGVLIVGRLDEIPPAHARRVVETNLLGTIYGSQAAIRMFRAQDSGVLINVSSGFGRFAAPLQAPYVATKFAVRGLSEALRTELRGTNVHVCTVMPSAVDTPVYRYTGNFAGRRVHPLGRALTPEKVARALVRLAERPQREVTLGTGVRLLSAVHTFAPGLYERLASRQVVEQDLLRAEPASATSGNLFEPDATWSGVSGGYKVKRKGLLRRLLGASAFLSAPAAAWLIWMRARGSTLG